MRCPSCGAENETALTSCFTCGSALVTSIRKGTVIAGRYEVLSPLGRGGMGIVYKAHDRVLDETVAIKVLRSDLADHADLARRFVSEIKLARRVRHPNVCAIHEYGEEGDTRFIAMEYLEGVDLRQTLKARGAFSPGEAARIAGEAARGLQAIHDLGIVHRDLKTPNVMLDAHGRVRLMDFGIAKKMDSETHATATGSILGTPEYMSPEQARGSRADVRSDVYSLGILTYELVTGRVPFRADTPLATLMKHVQESPAIEEIQPEGLRSIIARSLAKDPTDRFQTASEMATALERVAAIPEPAVTVMPPRSTSAAALALAVDRDAEPTYVPTPAPTGVPTQRPVAQSRAPTTAQPLGTNPAMPTTKGRRPAASRQVALSAVAVAALAGGAYVALREPSPAGPPAQPQLAAGVPPVEPPVVVATTLPSAQPPEEIAVVPVRPAPVARTAPPAANTKGAGIPPAPASVAGLPADPAPLAVTPPAAPIIEPSVPVTAAPATAPAVAPPPAAPAVLGKGLLMIQVKPEAEIAVDGEAMGRMANFTVPLSAGPHMIVFTHPKYQPLSRTVEITTDGRHRLVVDLKDDALPRR